MKIYIIRHGQDDNTVRGGWSDFGLTESGIEQANALAENLKLRQTEYNIGLIISSDLKRAVQTAEIVAASLDLSIETSDEFREVNNGDLAGIKNEIANKLYPNLYWRNLDWEQQYPNGESPKEFYERICNSWNNFIKKYKNYNRNILLITHGGVINVIKTIINNRPYSNKYRYSGIPCCKTDLYFEIKNEKEFLL